MKNNKCIGQIGCAFIQPWRIGVTGVGLLLLGACGGGGGGSNSPTPPSITSFTASPTMTRAGANVTLTGVFANGIGVVTPGSLPVSSGTPITVTPSTTTPYTLTVTGAAGTTAATLSATVTVAATGTVSGTALVTYLPFDAGTGKITPATPTPINYATNDINAILADGTTLPGTYNPATGAYSIPNVPSGYYWLQAGDHFIWTKQNSVNLGYSAGGRQWVGDSNPSDQLAVQLSGMDSWTSNDYLLFYDFNTNLDLYWGFSAGTTSTAGSMNLAWYGMPLFDSTKGDSPQIIQVVDSTVGATEHLTTPRKVNQADGTFTMVAGNLGAITGAFADIPQTDTVFVNFSRSKFAAIRTQYNPNYLLGWGPFIEFDSEPGATQYGNAGQWLDGVCVQNSDISVTTDLNLGALPSPALAPGFERISYAGENYFMLYQVPSASSAARFKVYGSRTYSLTAPDATHPIQPLLSPVQTPTINGNSLFTDQTGVGLTPTIAWAPPALGTPQEYGVHVYQLSQSGTSTSYQQVAELILDQTQTSTKLPAGILTTGQYYFILIRAMADATYDPTSAPLVDRKFPYGRAELASNMITP